MDWLTAYVATHFASVSLALPSTSSIYYITLFTLLSQLLNKLVTLCFSLWKMTKQESTSSETEFSDEVVRRLTILLNDVEDESELSSYQFPIKEEKIEEIMQELYKELSCSSFTEVDSITPPSTFLSSLPSPSISSISSLSFDGKSESCGASISRWESTMMAGVYLSENIVGKGYSGVGDHQKMEGCDGWEVGDEWLARVLLGWGPPLDLEEWT